MRVGFKGEKGVNNWIIQVHPEWHDIVSEALHAMDADYCHALMQSSDWLPGNHALLKAFSLPLSETRYLLLGESPYPRQESANGYAFWDAAVGSLWSETGMSKAVNRATSLRNWIKMFLFARGDLHEDFSQEAIRLLDKSPYCQTLDELFFAFMRNGFLLLNATLAFSPGKVRQHARHWQPFLQTLIKALARRRHMLELVLLGRIAEAVPMEVPFRRLVALHPYNLGFITHPDVVDFFKPFDLLTRNDQ